MYRKTPHLFRFHVQANIEGWAAAAAAVAVAGTAAYSAYSKSSAQQSQDQALSHQPDVIPYTPIDPTTSFNNYEGYRNSVLPQANADAASQDTVDNKAFQSRLSQTSPTLLSGIAQQGNLIQQQDAVAGQLLGGNIPSDVAGQVNRSSAYQALSGGYAGSTAAHALTARDLGTTSLALQQQGATMLGEGVSDLGKNLSYSAAVNPYNATGDSTVLSANQFLARDDQNDAIANATANKNQQINFQNSIYANAANNIDPLGGAIASGVGSAASAYFGGAGGGMFGGGSGGAGGGNGYSGMAYGYGQQTGSSGYYNPYLDPNMYNVNGNYTGVG